MNTRVCEFQHAVFSRVKNFKAHQKKDLIIRISNNLASNRAQKDIKELALMSFDENHRYLVRIHVEIG